MTKVKDLRKRFPSTFKAIDEMLADNSCMVHPHYSVSEDYIAVIEKAERAFADMAVKTLGDVVKVGDVKALPYDWYVEDFQTVKGDSALVVMVSGDYEFQQLIEKHYGDAGSMAQCILGQVFDGELSGMSVLR